MDPACAPPLVIYPLHYFDAGSHSLFYIRHSHYPAAGMLRRLRHKDYTVGWICALPVELAAARAMLDEEHADLEQVTHDDNLYALGSISGHNVVITCLPKGRMGNNASADVVTQLRATFKAVRFGLMVGIGGGVPGTNKLRLGDVVVSQPGDRHGGVVQYDFGKSTPSGFKITGSLNGPPQILLAAISRIISNAFLGRSMLSDHLSTLENLPVPYFRRDRTGPDILFGANDDHTPSEAETCDQCMTTYTQVLRPPRKSERDIKVHYGLIASGNQVMRSGHERDRVSNEFGGVLCFEMEAAGLMNTFPCLVVRGICDYSDSHKNKQWQPFAAGTAAAYAKEVLRTIPTSDLEKAPTADEHIRHSVAFKSQTFKQGSHQERSYDQPVGRRDDLSSLSQLNLDGESYQSRPPPDFDPSSRSASPPPHISKEAASQSRWSDVQLQGNFPFLEAENWRDPGTLLITIQNDSRFMQNLQISYPSFHSFIQKASMKDIVEIVRVLLQSGLNLNDAKYVGDYLDQGEANPHMWLLHDNWKTIGLVARFELFKLYVHYGANVIGFKTREGRTALHRACGHGLLDEVVLMLDKGADINWETSFGFPIQMAVLWKHTHIVDTLVQRGARLNVVSTIADQPLLEAMWRGNEDIVECLLRGGAEVNARWTKSNGPCGLAATPIIVGVAKGSLTMVRRILEEYGKYVDLNAKNAKNYTALHFALRSGAYPDVGTTRATQMVQLLLEHGASPDAIDIDNNHTLHYAAHFGLTESTRLLLRYGANKEVVNSAHRTPLTVAAASGHIDPAKVLIESGANLRPYPGHCKTALEEAQFYQKQEMVLFLYRYYGSRVGSWANTAGGYGTYLVTSQAPAGYRQY